MNVLKMFLVLGICAGQVFLVTQHFNRGGSGSRKPDVNPFGSNSIWTISQLTEAEADPTISIVIDLLLKIIPNLNLKSSQHHYLNVR